MVLHRSRFGGSICWDRSRCPHCQHTLAWYDLFPLLSYLYLRGKCRYCREKISPKYPLIELAMALTWGLTAYYLGFPLVQVDGLRLLWALWLMSIAFWISVYDLMYLEIPDRISRLAWISVLIYSIVNPSWGAILSALGIYSFFYLQILIPGGHFVIKNQKSFLLLELVRDYLLFPLWLTLNVFIPEKILAKCFLFKNYSEEELDLPVWIGGGDLIIGLIMGLLLGFPLSLVALAFSYFLGALIGVIMIFYHKWQKGERKMVPFVPFLVSGTLVAFLWGNQILDWYLKVFLHR